MQLVVVCSGCGAETPLRDTTGGPLARWTCECGQDNEVELGW